MAGRLLHYSDVENAHDRPARIARLAGCIDALDGADVLVVGTGDNTAPGVLSLVTEGRQALHFFDAVDPDFDTFGNHDFDYGPDALREIVRESPQTWVSANARLNGHRFGEGAGVTETALREVDGTTVGVTGVTAPKTPSMCPGAASLDFEPPVDAVSDACESLRTEGADVLVALTHLTDVDQLARETAVDVVLGGHTHAEECYFEHGTLVARPSPNARSLIEIDLGDVTATRHDVTAAAPKPRLRDRYQRVVSAHELDEVVDTVAEPISRSRQTTHAGECRIGNFVADAFRWHTDADVALQNSGGIREGDPLVGDVTVAEVVSIVPFDEAIVTVSVSESELRSVCAEADGERVPELGDWWHAHVSGLTLTIDADGDVEVTVDGESGSATEPYTLAIPAYLKYTDHEFPALSGASIVEQFDSQYEVVLAYARERGIDASVEGRIVRDY
jgi:2',3'-cyclic-nucleotide 2'-phosphodiesterase (5'-nucleotidase family)